MKKNSKSTHAKHLQTTSSSPSRNIISFTFPKSKRSRFCRATFRSSVWTSINVNNFGFFEVICARPSTNCVRYSPLRRTFSMSQLWILNATNHFFTYSSSRFVSFSQKSKKSLCFRQIECVRLPEVGSSNPMTDFLLFFPINTHL